MIVMNVTGRARFARIKCYRADVIIEVTPCVETFKITRFTLKNMNYPKAYTFKALFHEEVTMKEMFCRGTADHRSKQCQLIEMLLIMTRKYLNNSLRCTKEIQNQWFFHLLIKKKYISAVTQPGKNNQNKDLPCFLAKLKV